MTLPPHSKLPPFEFVGICKTGTGEPLHPRGYATDPSVTMVDGQWEMVFNHPIWQEKKWRTGAYQTFSRDGVTWSEPRVVLHPVEGGMQYETPYAYSARGVDYFAAQAYRYDARRNRTNELHIWVPQLTEFGGLIKLRPKFKWDSTFIDSRGRRNGGLSEPTIHGPYGDDKLLIIHQGWTYNGRIKPNVLATLIDIRRGDVLRYEKPLMMSNAENGCGQPQSLQDPKGGIHLFWQEKRGPRYEIHHSFTNGNLDAFWHGLSEKPVFTNSMSAEWRGRIAAASVAVDNDGRYHMWFHGNPDPSVEDGTYAIGYARSR